MTDQPDPEKAAFLPITGHDLARFHSAKGAGLPRCWVCGHGSWLIQSGEDVVTNAMPWLDPAGTSTENYFSSLILSCANCGTLWGIDYHMLREWLKANPK